jgi:hypothetical protein
MLSYVRSTLMVGSGALARSTQLTQRGRLGACVPQEGDNSMCLRRLLKYPPVEDIQVLLESARSISRGGGERCACGTRGGLLNAPAVYMAAPPARLAQVVGPLSALPLGAQPPRATQALPVQGSTAAPAPWRRAYLSHQPTRSCSARRGAAAAAVPAARAAWRARPCGKRGRPPVRAGVLYDQEDGGACVRACARRCFAVIAPALLGSHATAQHPSPAPPQPQRAAGPPPAAGFPPSSAQASMPRGPFRPFVADIAAR